MLIACCTHSKLLVPFVFGLCFKRTLDWGLKAGDAGGQGPFLAGSD